MKTKIKSKWLLAAGIYNLVWGILSIALPTLQLDILGIATSDIVVILWQCIGMIVGVYGIAYIIAATDPNAHWPVVLVGLLGKVFGVIGMLFYIANGTIPVEFGLTCCLNDLFWIPAFSTILLRKNPS
jgi:small multidrug resistance pump